MMNQPLSRPPIQTVVQPFTPDDLTEASIALNALRLLITAGRAVAAWRKSRRDQEPSAE